MFRGIKLLKHPRLVLQADTEATRNLLQHNLSTQRVTTVLCEFCLDHGTQVSLRCCGRDPQSTGKLPQQRYCETPRIEG